MAGQSCGLIRDVVPAGQVVRDVVRQAEEVLQQLALAVS
jgi:NAD(P)H-dependent flavin oxidoreductase YrpB (nitropropane dioxygenase family)